MKFIISVLNKQVLRLKIKQNKCPLKMSQKKNCPLANKYLTLQLNHQAEITDNVDHQYSVDYRYY